MKRIWSIFLLCMLSFVLIGCGSMEKEEETEEKEVQEVEQKIDVERYEAYLDVLEKVIENDEWPDGETVLTDGDEFGYIGENRFAVCDINQDKKEELLVEITTASMAGMQLRVYDYDEDTKEVVLQSSAFPAITFFDNGMIRSDASHNHTMGRAIWPYSLAKYNKRTKSYEVVGNAYCEDREWASEDFNEKNDKDDDGVIYYITDESKGMKDEPVTEKAYGAWRDSYMKDANEIYIPWRQMWEFNAEEWKRLINKEGAVIPISLAYGQTILQYDVTGDGEKDAIFISYEKEEDYDPNGYFGSDWAIEINGRKANDFEWHDGISLEVYLYQVSDKRQYLAVKECEMNNDDISGYALYQMKNGKLEKVCDFYEEVGLSDHSFHYGAEIEYMTKKEIMLRCRNQFNATAYMEWDMKYKYAVKQWKLDDTEHELLYEDSLEEKGDGMTANQKFSVYEDIDCEEVAYKVNKGDQLILHTVRIENGEVYFRVTNEDGEEGWLLDPKESYIEEDGEWIEGYFEEAMFAG